MRSLFVAGSLLVAGVAATLALRPSAAAEDAAIKPGESSHTMHGLSVMLEVPKDYDAEKEYSLVVVLHGNGGTESGMARSLQFLNEKGYIVLAPKSTDVGWSTPDVKTVRAIVGDFLKRVKVPPHRRHAVGFSNGGWNLAPLAFDEDLHFVSACWVAAGFKGGKPPKHAKKGMGVLALAGSQDANRSAAVGTPKLLEGKVRSAMYRLQKKLGHEWPRELMPFYGWWLDVQEGRFKPGETMALDWVESPRYGIASLAEGKRGGIGYWYSEDDDADNELAKRLQNEVMLDPAVQFYARQLVAWKADRNDEKQEFRLLNKRETPAIAIYGADGGLRKVLTGKIKAKSLASALKAVSPIKKRPKR